MPEKQFLVTEAHLRSLIAMSKSTDIFLEETYLEGKIVLDVFCDGVPKYSFHQGDVFEE